MTLLAPAALRIATYVLVADGLIALYLAGLVGPSAAAMLVLAVAASWWAGARARTVLGPGGRRVVVAVAAAASALDLAYLAGSVSDGLVRLLLFVLLFRFYTQRTRRDARTVAFLAFVMLVTASSAGFGFAFVPVFLVFVVAATCMLVWGHVIAETEAAGHAGDAIARPFLGVSAAAAVALVLITGGLFFLIPRIGSAALFRPPSGRMLTGFSDRVELGAIGQLETDPTVVMRVHLPASTPAEWRRALRWRGVVLDHFDGARWTASSSRRRTPLFPSGGHVFHLDVFRGRAPVVRQEIALEPLGTDVIFGAPRVLRAVVRADSVITDDAGTMAVANAAARLNYVVESELETGVRSRADVRVAEPLDPTVGERYRQLPADVPPRIARLAREITSGSASSADAAAALTAFLSGGDFRYTLALARETSLDPLEEFLFVRRTGNCEYFAAALAVMLRTLGIPARVVNGFQRGEWNPYGDYFMVRLLDAHAWVEVWVEDGGWITFDPSPRDERASPGAAGALALYMDAMRSRWFRWVVNWSLQDQVMAALRLRQLTPTEWSWRRVSGAVPTVPNALGIAVPIAMLVVLGILWRHRRARPAPARLPAFYRRTLRLLARRGFAPTPPETAREFCERVTAAWPEAAPSLSALTAEYERARFGGMASPAAALSLVLQDLRAAVRPPARPRREGSA